MLNSGLPYSDEILNKPMDEHLIVDMSDIKFDGILMSQYANISIIYLRNTDLKNIKLDFTKSDYDFKCDMLKQYLIGDIEYQIVELDDTWLKILGMYYNTSYNTNDCILTDDEMKKFIEDNEKLIIDVLTFCFSLPLYPLSRLDMVEEDKFTFDDVTHICGKPFNSNICNLIKNECFMLLFDNNDISIKPHFYDDIFTESNNKLFECVSKYTPFTALLYGMSSGDGWKEFSKGLAEYVDGVN